MPSTWTHCAVFSACLLGAVASAQAQPDAAGQLHQAKKSFADGALDRALEAIATGLEANAKHLELLRLRGEILLEKRDFEGARIAYEQFLAAKPRGANQRIARKILRDLRTTKTTFIALSVSPGPAVVYIESKALGVYCRANPTCRKGMLQGSYELIVEQEGFEPTVEKVKVVSNRESKLEVALVEKPSVVTFEVAPASATVELDGRRLPPGERQVTVKAGEHRLSATADGHLPKEISFTAERGRPATVPLELEPEPPAAPGPEVAAVKPKPRPVARSTASPSLLGVAIAGGATAAFLAAAATVGIISLQREESFDDAPLRRGSTLLFAGAAISAGVTLWLGLRYVSQKEGLQGVAIAPTNGGDGVAAAATFRF